MLYKFFIGIGRKDDPEGKAAAVLSLWDGFYLLIPFGLVRYFTKSDLSISRGVLIGAILAILAVNFLFIVYNKKYLKIYREFERDTLFVNSYGVITLMGFLVLPILAMVVFTFTIWK